MWYYVVNGERRGPVAESVLRSEESVTRDTLVWRQGMAAWTPLHAVPELS